MTDDRVAIWRADPKDGRSNWRQDAVAVGVPVLVATVIALRRSLRARMWRDEYSTSMYASLDPESLIAATGHVDRVFASYYLMMHFLSGILGTSEGMRVPSIVAFVGTVAVASSLAKRWWGWIAGLGSGLALAMNSSALWMGTNARPYAVSLFLFALALWLLDYALDGLRPWGWVGFGVCALGAVVLQPFAVLAIIPSGILLIGRLRRDRVFWVTVVAACCITSLGLLLASSQQAGQLAWLSMPTARDIIATLAGVSGFSPQRAVKWDALMLAGLGAMTLGALISSVDRRREMSLAITLFLAPPAMLLIASEVVSPLFVGRYLAWSQLGPAWLVGAALATALRYRQRAIAVGSGFLAGLLLVLAARTALQGAMGPISVGDDFPAAVVRLQSDAAVGDLVVVVQRYEQGGVAWGFARAADDLEYQQEILQTIPSGPLPVVDVRRISSLEPFRTERISGGSAICDAPSDMWVISIWPPAMSVDGSLPSQVAAAVLALPQDGYELLDGLRLYGTSCPAG